MIKAIERFFEVTSELERLTLGGYVSNQSKICYRLKELAEDNIGLRAYLALCGSDKEFTSLLGAQSFLLHNCPAYLMRLNMWFPTMQMANTAVAKRSDKFLSIDVCHNHNFDFFTVGLFGPGYRSDYYHSCEDMRLKNIGDAILFDHKWDVQLPVGASMFVKRSEDFHIQWPPDSLSMTINLIPHRVRDPGERQVVLDQETMLVKHILLPGVVEGSPSGRTTDIGARVAERMRSLSQGAAA